MTGANSNSMEPLQTKDWDRDKVWMQIEEQLQKKRRKRAIWFWWMGSLCLGLLAFSSYVYLYHHTNTPLGQFPIHGKGSILQEGPMVVKKVDQENQLSSAKIPVQEFTVEPARSSTRQQAATSTPIPSLANQNLSSSLSSTATLAPIARPLSVQPEVQERTGFEKRSVLPPLKRLDPYLYYQQQPLSWQLSTPRTTQPWNLSIKSSWLVGQVDYSGPQDWISAKEGSETFNFSHAHSLLLEGRLTAKWYGYLGIQHQLHLNTYDFSTTSVQIRNVPSDSAVVYQLDGLDPIYESGSLQETTTSRRWIVQNNELHRWSIPFGLGLRHENGKIGLQATLGMNFQFWQGFKGVALHEGMQSHILDQGAIRNKYYRNPWQFNFNSSIALSYRLHPQYILLFGLEYQKDNLISIQTQPYQADYELWGLSLGIRMPIRINPAQR